MSNSNACDVYQKQLEEAERLFDGDRMNECIATVHKNLDEPDVLPNYVIRNHLLLACAVDDWDEAKTWIRMAEVTYYDALFEARQKFHRRALQLLAPLRKGIDTVEEWRLTTIFGMTLEERIEARWEEDMDSSSEDESAACHEEDPTDLGLDDAEAINEADKEMNDAMDQFSFDDAKGVAEAEKEKEVTAEHICTPIRTKVQVPAAQSSGMP